MVEFILYLLFLLMVALSVTTVYMSYTIARIKKELKRMKFAEDEDV
jgi:hypothetical protein